MPARFGPLCISRLTKKMSAAFAQQTHSPPSSGILTTRNSLKPPTAALLKSPPPRNDHSSSSGPLYALGALRIKESCQAPTQIYPPSQETPCKKLPTHHSNGEAKSRWKR